ncbi:MAG TPA: LysR family transcriptional regulator [Paraburkholderia sp.]|jgi:DNA-binding transcriptional LysR family regulator|nr:LysR family transcriptional regulator [Paraburkholderia sp.]
MEFRQLKTFLAVASTLNFTRAAEQLHLAQSSVTEQIQTLETDLGAALFDRSRRKLQMTEAGRRLIDYARDVLCLVDEARASVADAAGQPTGALTIGALETLGVSRLPALLATFAQRHPMVELQLKVEGSGALRSAVNNGTVDICFRFGEPVADPGVENEVIANEPLVIIAPPGHRLAGRKAAVPADFAAETFLVTEQGCVYRSLFEAAFPPGEPGRPRLAGEFGSVAAICRLVETGLGCAIVPALVALDAREDLVVLPWVGQVTSVPVVMSWRARRAQPQALSAFLDAARQSVRAAVRSGDGHRRREALSP